MKTTQGTAAFQTMYWKKKVECMAFCGSKNCDTNLSTSVCSSDGKSVFFLYHTHRRNGTYLNWLIHRVHRVKLSTMLSFFSEYGSSVSFHFSQHYTLFQSWLSQLFFGYRNQLRRSAATTTTPKKWKRPNSIKLFWNDSCSRKCRNNLYPNFLLAHSHFFAAECLIEIDARCWCQWKKQWT